MTVLTIYKALSSRPTAHKLMRSMATKSTPRAAPINAGKKASQNDVEAAEEKDGNTVALTCQQGGHGQDDGGGREEEDAIDAPDRAARWMSAPLAPGNVGRVRL
jgi:hypothetical protein